MFSNSKSSNCSPADHYPTHAPLSRPPGYGRPSQTTNRASEYPARYTGSSREDIARDRRSRTRLWKISTAVSRQGEGGVARGRRRRRRIDSDSGGISGGARGRWGGGRGQVRTSPIELRRVVVAEAAAGREPVVGGLMGWTLGVSFECWCDCCLVRVFVDARGKEQDILCREKQIVFHRERKVFLSAARLLFCVIVVDLFFPIAIGMFWCCAGRVLCA